MKDLLNIGEKVWLTTFSKVGNLAMNLFKKSERDRVPRFNMSAGQCKFHTDKNCHWVIDFGRVWTVTILFIISDWPKKAVQIIYQAAKSSITHCLNQAHKKKNGQNPVPTLCCTIHFPPCFYYYD